MKPSLMPHKEIAHIDGHNQKTPLDQLLAHVEPQEEIVENANLKLPSIVVTDNPPKGL